MVEENHHHHELNIPAFCHCYSLRVTTKGYSYSKPEAMRNIITERIHREQIHFVYECALDVLFVSV